MQSNEKTQDQLFYDIDFSFCHSNDPFVDFSIPAIQKNSLDTELNYLTNKLKIVGLCLDDELMIFRDKWARCSYCTKNVLMD